MTATNPLARIPSELSDQWKREEREHVETLILQRAKLLEIAADEDADIEEGGRADEEAELILAELNHGYNVTPEMLVDDLDYQEQSLFEPETLTEAENVTDDLQDAPLDDEPADNADDPRDDEMEQLTLPGAGKPGSRLSRKVALEGKFIGKGVRLTREVTDADAVFRLMAQVRLDHNSETPQRNGSGPNATTESVVKTQHFRVLRFEILSDVDHVLELLDQMEPEDLERVREALEAR